MTSMTTSIRSGKTIENSVTVERIHFLQTAAETNGELVEIEVAVQPDGAVRLKVAAGPGEVVTVEAGTVHSFRSAGEGVARFRCDVRPALQFERFLETMFSLAADGKTSRKGMPSPLRLAVIANAHFDDVRLPYVPAFV